MPLSIASTLKRAAGPLLKVPTADGAAGEALLTDGDGNLSFGNPVPAAHNHDGSYQPLDAELSAIAGLSSAADRLPYFTGSGTAALADLSTAGRALIDDADAAAQRSTLGLGTAATQNAGAFEAAGTAATAVSAHEAAGDPHPQYLTASEGSAAYQPLDAELTALAGLTSGANKLPYFSGSGAAALTDLSAAGRALIDDADAAAQRTTLGLGTAAVEAASAFQPADAQLTDLSALSYSGNALKALRVNAAATGLEFASIGGGSTELDIHAQSSTYAQQASDLGDLIDFDTAGQTLNLLAAATAGDKYFCWVRYRGADTGVLTVDGNSSETIDGLATITMYAGEVRLLICDGSNWQTLLAGGGFVRFTSSGSFIVPSRVRGCRVQVIGGGGGGGGGQGAAAGGLRTGGGGGGGGAHHEGMISPSDLGAAGATITVTVAAQSSAASAASNGSAGGASSFGALMAAYGGGGGRAGSNEAISGGGGGGVGSVGSNGSNGNVSGGQPVTGANTIGIGGAGAGTSAGGTARHAEYGGAAGGNTTAAAASTSGGRSIRGGGGGGGGGGCTAANAETAGSDGGLTGDISAAQVGGGGAGGATNGGAGSSGAAGANGFCGSGGGGGGGQDGGTGGAAGDGGAPGGGGGGGGGGTSTGGAGGRGARGECRVWFW